MPLQPAKLQISPDILRMIPAEIARKHRVLPIRQENDSLVVGVENPEHTEAIERLQFVTNRQLVPCAISPAELTLAIWRFYGPCETLTQVC